MKSEHWSLRSLPLQVIGVLLVLSVYQIVIYGFWMRVRLHVSNVFLPWIMSQPGYALYDNVWISYTPGYLWVNKGLLALVPDHVVRLRGGMAVVAVVTMLLVFWLARQLWGQQAGVIAAVWYALWGPVVMDIPLRFEVILGLLSLVGVMLWHNRETGPGRVFAAGIMVGLTITAKNHGVMVLIAYSLWWILTQGPSRWRAALRDLAVFAVGVAVPIGLTGLVLIASGRLGNAWFLAIDSIDEYAANYFRMPGLQEWAVLGAWLVFIPVLAVQQQRTTTYRQVAVLLLLLIFALAVPAYPSYARSYLSGVTPIAAVISGGAIWQLWHNRIAVARRGTVILTVFSLLLAGTLPTYYRIRLGARNAEVEAHYALNDWLMEEAFAPPGTSMWILPELDQTSNFYAVSGMLPPDFWMLSFFIESTPTALDRQLTAVKTDPPQYVIIAERWRNQIPQAELDFINEHYDEQASTDLHNDLGLVVLYRHNGS